MRYFIKKLFLLSLVLSMGAFAGFGGALKKQKFLSPEEAFQTTAVASETSIDTHIIMADKIHIYEKSLHYRIVSPKNIELSVKKEKAHLYDGDKVYDKELLVQIPLSDISAKVSGDYTLEIEYQGCSDAGICYQPIKTRFDFNGTGEEGFFSKITSLAKSGQSDDIADALSNESGIFIIFLFFVAGLLMALTPCILPMIPILSSIILQQANKEGEVKKSTAMTISLVYVVSMALMYALIGVVAGTLDFDLQANMNNPWVILPLVAIFVALAFSLFGYFELALPASWQAKLNGVSNGAESKGLVGTAIMGALSALIVGACTAPIISGAILFIMFTGKALLGGIALFFMGIGAGVPLLFVGAGASRFVPKPGGWMNIISKFFGVLMILMALFMLSKLMPNDNGDRGYSIERLTQEVQASSKPVVIDIYKAGCAACTELEELTFPDPKVKKAMENFTFIHIDVTDYSDKDKALLKKYKLFGAPNIIFFDKDNQYLPEKSLTGFIPAEAFAKHLRSIK